MADQHQEEQAIVFDDDSEQSDVAYNQCERESDESDEEDDQGSEDDDTLFHIETEPLHRRTLRKFDSEIQSCLNEALEK